MLVLTRKMAESIRIGDDIVIKVIKTGKGAVKLGIEAPDSVRVIRGELREKGKPEAAEPPLACVYGGIVSDQFPHLA